MVIVSGEAGIGKSSLVDEVSGQAAAEGWLRIGGACLELQGGQVAYLPFVEALRSLVAQVPADRVRPLVWPARELIGRLLPELAIDVAATAQDGDGTAGGEGGDLDRARLFESLLIVAGRLAGAQPLLVVIEDIQWADPGTVDLLALLRPRRRSSAGPVDHHLARRWPGRSWIRRSDAGRARSQPAGRAP